MEFSCINGIFLKKFVSCEYKPFCIQYEMLNVSEEVGIGT
jgi:hypothetical protein